MDLDLTEEQQLLKSSARDFFEKEFPKTKVKEMEEHPIGHDPQVVANNYLPEFDHPNYGKIRLAPIPFEFNETPGALRLPAPEFGQHTEEILMELMGYGWDQIAELKNEQVIVQEGHL